MSKAPDGPRLAVLIDGENVPAKDAGALFSRIGQIGNPIIRRVYGDFTKESVRDWAKVISHHGGSAHQNGHTSAGKNASDIALVVDAMDFLHKRSVEGFCIVTSDGDFTSLAKRIREDGLKVYCFGHTNAAKALKAACDGFFALAQPSAAPPEKAVPAPTAPKQLPEASTKTPAKKATPTPVKQQPNLAKPAIEQALAANGTEWMTLSALGIAIRAKEPSYLKKTGFGSLKKLLNALNAYFEQATGSDGKTPQVRRKP